MRAWMVLTGSFVVVATHAVAESPARRDTPKSALYLQAGLSSGSSHMGGATVGGTIVRDLGSRLAIEGSGAYLGRGMGADALSLSANLLVHLRPRHEKAVPYLTAGGGIYRASFDMGNSRFDGPMGAGMMGGNYSGGYGMMGGYPPYSSGGAWNIGQMPMFYGNRMGNMTYSQDGRFYGHRSFSDPAISLGGGIRVDVGSKLFLRPDARALVVVSNGDSYTVGVFTLNLGYGF